jgi:hypothetical protein
MLFSVLVSTLLRVSGRAHFKTPTYVSVADFGFYANGTLDVAWDSPLGEGSPYRVDLVVFTENQINSWAKKRSVDGRWHDCDATDSVANCSAVLNPMPQYCNLTIPLDATCFVIIRSCYASDPPSGDYFVDANFTNPNGQHLDARDVPSLHVLPVAIVIFFVLLVFWVVLIVIKRGGFHRMHIFIGLIVVFYLLFLAFYEASLYYGQEVHLPTVWTRLRIAFDSLYDALFFSVVVVASSGCFLLNVEIRWYSVVLAVGSVTMFVGSSFVQLHLDLALWEIVVIFVQFASLAWILWTIWQNTLSARRAIRAHLLVIQNDGIEPTSTPIYQKFMLYHIFLYVAGIAFVLFLALNVFLAFVGADAWVVGMVGNIVQFLLIGALMFLFRPRGAEIDRFMVPDSATEGQERGEVALEDLDSFAPDGAGEGMRQWETGMELPLQPVVVSSKEQKRKSVREEQRYDSVATPLVADADPE